MITAVIGETAAEARSWCTTYGLPTVGPTVLIVTSAAALKGHPHAVHIWLSGSHKRADYQEIVAELVKIGSRDVTHLVNTVMSGASRRQRLVTDLTTEP